MVPSDAVPSPTRGSEEDVLRRLTQLESQVAGLQRRLDLLEGVATAPLPPVETARSEPEGRAPLNVLALAGRALLVLGGAFLIRALTEGGTLPKGLGVLLGALYAAMWGLLALRSRGPEATLHVCLATVLFLPLLFEATTRFDVLSPGIAALSLGGGTAGLLAVAWRRDLQGAAWTALLAALASGFLLMGRTGALVPFTALFLLLGGGVLWLTYGRRWHALRWPAALMADLAVLVTTSYAAAPGGPPESMKGLSLGWAMALALGLVVVYVGSIAVRTLQRTRKVNVFEVAQTTLAVTVGFGGAIRVALASGSGLLPFGIAAAVVGGACYAVAFAFMEKDAEAQVNFFFFTTLALVFTLIGGLLVVPPAGLVSVFAALGALSLILGVRQHRWVLRTHSAVYVSAVAFLLGVHRLAAQAFWGRPPLDPLDRPLVLLGFAAALALAHVYTVLRRAKVAMAWWRRLPALVFGVWALAAWGELLVLGLAPRVAEAPALAALRTAALSALALGAAFLPRWAESSELDWLAYPLLGLTAFKVLLEDLPAGKPLPLAIGFACLGIALVVTPRARKGRVAQT